MTELVPEGWKLEPLSALADYHNGRAFKPEDWSKEGLPILRIAQINDPFRETDFYKGSESAADALADVEAAYVTVAKEAGFLK